MQKRKKRRKTASSKAKSAKRPEKIEEVKQTKKARKKELERTKMLLERNRKVAENRGEAWRQKLKNARLSENDTLLKRKRIEKNISQRDMEKVLPITQSSYSKIEKRSIDATPKVAQKIARRIGVRVSDVFRKPTKESKRLRAF